MVRAPSTTPALDFECVPAFTSPLHSLYVDTTKDIVPRLLIWKRPEARCRRLSTVLLLGNTRRTLILTKHQLYPNEKAWPKGPIGEVVRRFSMVRDTRTHKCDFDQQCPPRK
ncbi:hypothetical protein LY76DRAFT_204104 [Colletotrichum caudatum]|nr:hypothetical protein LY76DRAFT_204104 [Colletotrichum caudatum]